MKRKFKFVAIKYTILFFSLFCLVVFISVAFLFQKMRSSTPQLSVLAKKMGKPAAALTYNISKNIDSQINLFSRNLGIENNSNVQEQIFRNSEVGVRGFFVVDVRPKFSQNIFSNMDDILKYFLDYMEEGLSFKTDEDFFDPEQVSVQNQKENFDLSSEDDSTIPLENPVVSIIKEVLNGETFLFGGATLLQLSNKDALFLLLEPYLKKYFGFSTVSLRTILNKNTPVYVQNFLTNHSMDVSFETLSIDPITQVNRSQLTISIINKVDFLNSVCSAKINPWDFCGRFQYSRENFRRKLEVLLSILDSDFKIQLQFFWTIQGNMLVYSNQGSFVQTMLDPNTQINSENIITSVTSSGDDILMLRNLSQKYSNVSVMFDLIRIQNEAIEFMERMKKQSYILSDYFSSPGGTYEFLNIENNINVMTNYSQKLSFSFPTDGNKILPEIRLYSPSKDLFIDNGKALTPEIINAIQFYITKAASFGNYFLPRGLLPIPGPYVERNGKWVILRSEINVKSLAPYLENVNPYYDKYLDSTKF